MSPIDIPQLLADLDSAFLARSRPRVLHIGGAHSAVGEYPAIQADFGSLDRDELSDAEVGMMLIDLPLLNDEAVLYFLPALARGALLAQRDPFALRSRIAAFSHSALTENESTVLRRLLDVCLQIEACFASADL